MWCRYLQIVVFLIADSMYMSLSIGESFLPRNISILLKSRQGGRLVLDHRSTAANPPEQGGNAAEELGYRLRQQQLTAEFGLFALKTHVTSELLQEATRLCAEGMYTRLCKVMAFQPQEGVFLMVAGVGWKPGYVGNARSGADLDSPAGYAFQTGAAVISNHLENETRFRTPKILADHGVRRAINVMIRVGDEPFGVLEVDSPVEGRFTQADLAFMQGFANLLGVALDRHRVESALRTNQDKLGQALDHQNVLTQEVSHRVKNSLSLVGGLLQLQSRASVHPEVRAALSDAESRVMAIAQLHDRLWRTGDVHNLDLREFLTSLCEKFSGVGLDDVLTWDVPTVMVQTDDAIPLGLLVNELLTNAMKYATPQTPGDIRVIVTANGPVLRLEVRDHGPGLPSGWSAESSKSLGMKLISRLGRQLGGKAQWQNALPGTRFVLEFTL
jgi:two-component sensor histidine kinase